MDDDLELIIDGEGVAAGRPARHPFDWRAAGHLLLTMVLALIACELVVIAQSERDDTRHLRAQHCKFLAVQFRPSVTIFRPEDTAAINQRCRLGG